MAGQVKEPRSKLKSEMNRAGLQPRGGQHRSSTQPTSLVKPEEGTERMVSPSACPMAAQRMNQPQQRYISFCWVSATAP